MLSLALVGFVGGLITGISPCVLPVLPVIFLSGGAQSTTSRARPFLVILGLVLSFSLFTLLGSLLLTALHLPQDALRWAGLVALVLIGMGLIVPQFQHLLERPFSWIPQRAVSTDRGGLVLGLALGAVYVPCAGPVLAAITVAGATGKIGPDTVLLTIAFAVGTALPLLVFALAGRGVAQRVAAFRRHQRGIRITGGVVMIALAVGLTFNLPEALQRIIPDYTSQLQAAAGGDTAVTDATAAGGDSTCVAGADHLVNCGTAPEFSGISDWFNTPDDAALTLASLKGQVVLIDFWAYSCINCQRATPHVEAWYDTYEKSGLTVIGVHAPEYAFEHVLDNVKAGAERLGITYPVAIDNDFSTWSAYGNQYWPAEYLIDADGHVRHVSFGEGGYPDTEKLIRQLLQAADPDITLPPATEVADTTPQNPEQTPETYLGTLRAPSTQYVGSPALADGSASYTAPDTLCDDCYALAGDFAVDEEGVTSAGSASIDLDYNASHVYLNTSGTGTLTVTDEFGTRTIAVSGAPNIYDLVPPGTSGRHDLTVTLSDGLKAYSFTFG